MNNETQALKPCPFCGGIGLDFTDGTTFRWMAYSCVDCGIGSETRVQTMGAGSIEEWKAQAQADAVTEWNKRAEVCHKAEEIAWWRLGCHRYETARLMPPAQWAEAWNLNITTGKPFDEIIDDMRPFLMLSSKPEGGAA